MDDFRDFRDSYRVPKYPILLCHGLMGFDKIELPTGHSIEYFNGVKDVLEERGASVITRSVPPMASIQLRGTNLFESLLAAEDMKKAKTINIIAHSMGGLDARYMISKLLDKSVDLKVASLTTLSTPHRGSPIADLFQPVTRHFGENYRAFAQLTTEYMTENFNKNVLDDPNVAYYSYGAKTKPGFASPFFLSGEIIQQKEGDNDGMVSVESAKWGEYLGTLDNVDHGDIINMTRFKPRSMLNHSFTSQAMYLHIMENLAKLGF